MKECELYYLNGEQLEITFNYTIKMNGWVCTARISGFPVISFGKHFMKMQAKAFSLERILMAYGAISTLIPI